MPVLKAELESAIVRDPDDLDAYAVYGDWLAEQGDPRGELIALQLRGADAKVLVGGESPIDENTAERVSELIANNWTTWLGDVSQLVVRQGSVFRDGFLSFVQVGGENTPHGAWIAFRGHRELCAVKEVRRLMTSPRGLAKATSGASSSMSPLKSAPSMMRSSSRIM